MNPPKTISVPEAGEYFGLKRNAAYEAARRGELPVIKIGKRLRVPVVALERMLEEARPTARNAAAEELLAYAGWPPSVA